MARNYYLVLGIAPDATPEEIRSAYREKALRYHPDNYGSDSGPFRDVQEAYGVLSDPGRRRAYDRSLRPGPRVRVHLQAGPRPGPARRPPVEPLDPAPRARTPDVSLVRSFETFRPSFEEIFDRLWGNFEGPPRPKAERVEGLTVDVPLSADDAARGGRVRVLVPALVACPTCGGHGGLGPWACWRCGGEGAIADECPVSVAYPPGMIDGHAVSVCLDRLGIRNLFLTVRFRIA